ncbi:MAG: hypothetical protein JWP03_2755 [Phycisphaerales bacterium]|nr:hypothetical protein [Phycisphaerales bacterium]
MSRLISRILLAVFLLPLSAMVYLAVFVPMSVRMLWLPSGRFIPWFGAGLAAWTFMAIYWWLLWRGSIRWSRRRIGLSFGFAFPALLVAGTIGYLLGQREEEFGCFMGSALAPLLWIVSTIFLWRETAAERKERLHAAGHGAVVCPTCGYNLTGLTTTRCPECGGQLTLDELIAAQPARESRELE